MQLCAMDLLMAVRHFIRLGRLVLSIVGRRDCVMRRRLAPVNGVCVRLKESVKNVAKVSGDLREILLNY